MSALQWLSLGLFGVSFIFFVREVVSKTVIALIGAIIFIVLDFTTEEVAFAEHIDWNVLLLLIGMMLLVGITQKTGLFQFFAIKMVKLARGRPRLILLFLGLLTAVFSALLDNVTTVVILIPVSMLIAVELGISPLPFVITNALASNIGGTATLIGDPPNIMIGSAAHLSFSDFLFNLGPPVAVILLLNIGLLVLLFHRQLEVSELRKQRVMNFDERQSLQNPVLLVKCVIVWVAVMLGFLLHDLLDLEVASIALLGAAVLMLLMGAKEVDKHFHQVEWGTIFFFLGLFVMVGGLVDMGVVEVLSHHLLVLVGENTEVLPTLILWMSGLLSGLIDNIPYVATMIPLVENMGGGEELWWSLALGSCLGGNATLIGASANVISVNIASKSGYRISFMQFTKYGMLVTVLSLLVSNVYLILRF